MGNKTSFPIARRAWEANVDIYRNHLTEEKHSSESIERILAEMQLFYERLYAYQVFTFDIHSLTDNAETPFSPQQLNLVKVSANKLTHEFLQHVNERMGTAASLILHLLKQKHRD